MANFIVKLVDEDDNKDYYLEWSSIVDSPITYGMLKNQFLNYYLMKYGENDDLDERLERVEKKGTSSHLHKDVDDLIENNYAGDYVGYNKHNLTKKEIIKEYCKNK